MREHLRKWFGCPDCGRFFTYRLDRERLIVTGVEHRSCSNCGYATVNGVAGRKAWAMRDA